MPATVATRPRRPELTRNTLPSFMAAVAMHALLILGIWLELHWHTSAEAPAVAELWAPLPSLEPPAPPPPPPPPVPAQPEVAKPDADIVQQQQVKPHAPDQESPPPMERRPVEKEKPAPRKKEEKKAEPKPTPEQIAREEHQAEERRQQEIARITGQAGGTAHAAAASSGVISATYAALINACIRPHIVFAAPDGVSDQVYAEFKVELLPTGEQAAPPKLTKPSGLAGYDDAAERAIIRCDPFPRDRDGTVPRTFTLKMYPTETR